MPVRLIAFAISIALLVEAALPFLGPKALAIGPDQDVSAGHFFGQTTGGDGLGFFVLDEGRDPAGSPVRFWGEYRRLGAVNALGYPISRRFSREDGFVYQAFQRGVLQWRPDSATAVLANTFDWLGQAGQDPWLETLGVPPSIADDGSGGDWHLARATRLAWLTEPQIKAKFLAPPSPSSRPWTVDDAIELYGLPTSRPEKRGPFFIQRFQRVSFQLWVEDVAGMPPRGSVSGVLGGDLLKQAAIIPADALTPQSLSGAPAETPAVRAVYLSYSTAGLSKFRQRILDLAATTEVNGVVLDVKGDRGFTTYQSNVPLAREIGSGNRATVADFPALVAQLKQHGLYLIARIVVFKDDPVGAARPDLAIADASTGRPWRDNGGVVWTDPFHQQVWDYNIALAKEAASHGFDEVQFDYIRFPGDGPLDSARFSQPASLTARSVAIAGFLAAARAQLQPLGIKLSADLFGYTAWRQEPSVIGQQMEEMARSLDVVSPMLYPSTFTSGIPGYRPGVVYPYQIVSQSVQRAVARLRGTGVVVRPWLQDFPDYSYDRRPYTAAEVSAQIRGARDGGALGWMLWDPRNVYTKEALAPE